MEEAVWTYFGVVIVILTIGIVTAVFMNFSKGNDEQVFFDGLQQLGQEAKNVCAAPQETMLSVTFSVPASSIVYTQADKICGKYGEKVRCVPSSCQLVPHTVLNLTNSTIARSHLYTCTVLNNVTLDITCAG